MLYRKLIIKVSFDREIFALSLGIFGINFDSTMETFLRTEIRPNFVFEPFNNWLIIPNL